MTINPIVPVIQCGDNPYKSFWFDAGVRASIHSMKTFLLGVYIIEYEDENNTKASREEVHKLYKKLISMSDDEVRLEYHKKRSIIDPSETNRTQVKEDRYEKE